MTPEDRTRELSLARHPSAGRRSKDLPEWTPEVNEVAADVALTLEALRSAGVDRIESMFLADDIVRRRVGVELWAKYRNASASFERRLRALQANGVPLKQATRRRSRRAA
jgi:hypothetical protein